MVKYDAKQKSYYCKFSYKDWTGKTRWTTKRGFTRRKDALAYEMDAKRADISAELTVAQLADLWIDDCKKRELAANSIRQRVDIVRLHIKPYLGDMIAAEVDVNTVRQWFNNINKDFAHATKMTIRTALTMIFNFGVHYYGLARNPLSALGSNGKRTSTLHTAAHQIWETDDFNKFIGAIPPEFIERRLLYTLLFYSGMRVGEAMALGVSDFDFTANTIKIDKTYVHINDKVGPPKTPSSFRTIIMPREIMQAIQAFINSFETPPERIFGETFPHKVAGRWLKTYAKRAGVKPIRIHDLRHSHASLLIRQQVPITDISRRLGHKNGTVTLQVYSHFYKSGDAEIAQKLSDLGNFGSLLGQG